MRQVAGNPRASTSTQTDQLHISDNDLVDLCSSCCNYNNYGHYYSIPAELLEMSTKEAIIYEAPDCQEHYCGASSQTDLSLSFLDLSIASDLEDEDDDFSGSDDCSSRTACGFGGTVAAFGSKVDKDHSNQEDNQFMYDLLERITPPTPPMDSSHSSSSTPSSSASKFIDTTSSSSSSSSKNSSSYSSSSSHNRCLEFDSYFKESSLQTSKSHTNNQDVAQTKKKSKRPVPRMGTKLDFHQRSPNIFDNVYFPPPPPDLLSPSSSEYPSSFPSPLQPCQSPTQCYGHASQTLDPLYLQHVYQDLIFDLPDVRGSPESPRRSGGHQAEPLYHVLSLEHVVEQQRQSGSSGKQQPTKEKHKKEHRVTFDLRKSSDEDIYENDYEVKTLLNDLSMGRRLSQCPPPLPKRPTQVKFTPINQQATSSSESGNVSPTSTKHSSQATNMTIFQDKTVAEEQKRQPAKQKNFGQLGSPQNVTKSIKPMMDNSVEGEMQMRQRNKKLRDATNRPGLIYNLETATTDRKVVVIGEDGVDKGKGEVYGKLAEIMYTNRANLCHTIMLQQKLFQQQLQADPSNSGRKHSLVPNSQNLRSPWEAVPQQIATSPAEWVIKRRPDGTRYITRRSKHSKTRESKTAHKVTEKATIPVKTNSAAPPVPTIMPIFRTKRSREKSVANATEGVKYPLLAEPMVKVDSFAALQSVLQGKVPIQNNSVLSKQSMGKPLLSVTTI